MRSWMNLAVDSLFQMPIMVSLTVLFSRVAEPLMEKRKSGQAGSREATQNIKLTKAQMWLGVGYGSGFWRCYR